MKNPEWQIDPAELGEEVRLTAEMLQASGEFDAYLEKAEAEDADSAIISAIANIDAKEVVSIYEKYLDNAINENKINIQELQEKINMSSGYKVTVSKTTEVINTQINEPSINLDPLT